MLSTLKQLKLLNQDIFLGLPINATSVFCPSYMSLLYPYITLKIFYATAEKPYLNIDHPNGHLEACDSTACAILALMYFIVILPHLIIVMQLYRQFSTTLQARWKFSYVRILKCGLLKGILRPPAPGPKFFLHAIWFIENLKENVKKKKRKKKYKE